jgi:hypothetical protein
VYAGDKFFTIQIAAMCTKPQLQPRRRSDFDIRQRHIGHAKEVYLFRLKAETALLT